MPQDFSRSREKDKKRTIIILLCNMKMYYKCIQIGMHKVNKNTQFFILFVHQMSLFVVYTAVEEIIPTQGPLTIFF